MEGTNNRRPKSSIVSSQHIARLLIPFAGLLVLLGMVYLWQSSQSTMTGQRALELQDKLERIRRENSQLEYEIATLTTPDKIAERARKLGLRPVAITQTTYTVFKNYSVTPANPAGPNADTAEAGKSNNPIGFLWNELTARLGWGPNSVEPGP
jgi:cell division protein FtsB